MESYVMEIVGSMVTLFTAMLAFLYRLNKQKAKEYDEFLNDNAEYRDELRGSSCQCGITSQLHNHLGNGKLHVHHKDRNKENNHPSNFDTLCAWCHTKKKKRILM